MVIFVWSFYKSKPRDRSINIKMMDIINNLIQGVKIREMDSKVTKTMNAATFYQVWHPYMLIHAILDTMMNQSCTSRCQKHSKLNTKKKDFLEHD